MAPQPTSNTNNASKWFALTKAAFRRAAPKPAAQPAAANPAAPAAQAAGQQAAAQPGPARPPLPRNPAVRNFASIVQQAQAAHAQPVEPVAPSSPAQPSATVQREQPPQPAAKAQPVQPVAPSSHAQPSSTVQREQPPQPAAKAQPDQPVAPSSHAQPSSTVQREQPPQPAAKAQPDQPVAPSSHAQPSSTVQREQPPQPAAKAQPVQPVAATPPANPSASVQPDVWSGFTQLRTASSLKKFMQDSLSKAVAEKLGEAKTKQSKDIADIDFIAATKFHTADGATLDLFIASGDANLKKFIDEKRGTATAWGKAAIQEIRGKTTVIIRNAGIGGKLNSKVVASYVTLVDASLSAMAETQEAAKEIEKTTADFVMEEGTAENIRNSPAPRDPAPPKSKLELLKEWAVLKKEAERVIAEINELAKAASRPKDPSVVARVSDPKRRETVEKAQSEIQQKLDGGQFAEAEKLIRKFASLLSFQSQPSVRDIVVASYQKAGAANPEQKREAPAPEHFAGMALWNYESKEFKKFETEFAKLAKTYQLNTDDALPKQIWKDLTGGLSETGYHKRQEPPIPTKDGRFQMLQQDHDDPAQRIREAALQKAIDALEKFMTHARENFGKIVDFVKTSPNKTWAFWSGLGAKDAAMAHAEGGIVLELTGGGWFQQAYTFKPFTDVDKVAVWAALSELYAQKAAECYQDFNFIGFVGKNGDAPTTVFRCVEEPAMIQVLNREASKPRPQFTWYAVQHAKDPNQRDAKWEPTGKLLKMPSREAALEVVKQYK